MISKTSVKDVKLASFTEKNIKKTFEWVNDPEFRKLFLMRGKITWGGHLEYFEKSLKDPSKRIYAITCDGLHVGNCGIKHLSFEKREGEIWIYIGEKSLRNKGVGYCATGSLLSKAFDVFGLEKIYLHLADFNIAARKLYRKFGFREAAIQNKSSEWSNRGCKVIRLEIGKDSWT